MKIFNQFKTISSIVFLSFALGGCATTSARDSDTVIGSEVGGVAGVLPAASGAANASDAAGSPTGTKTSGAKKPSSNPAAK